MVHLLKFPDRLIIMVLVAVCHIVRGYVGGLHFGGKGRGIGALGLSWLARNASCPARVTVPNSVVRTVREICWKNLALTSRLSRSLKVIGTDTDRSATYDFLLVIRVNRFPR